MAAVCEVMQLTGTNIQRAHTKQTGLPHDVFRSNEEKKCVKCSVCVSCPTFSETHLCDLIIFVLFGFV